MALGFVHYMDVLYSFLWFYIGTRIVEIQIQHAMLPASNWNNLRAVNKHSIRTL